MPVVGRLNFDVDKLEDNIRAFISHVQGMKPNAAKGTYVRSINLSATMSPGLQVAL